MAYPTCPECKMQQMASDEAIRTTCYSCYIEFRYDTCSNCNQSQTVSSRWTAYTCSACMQRVDLPRRLSYSTATKARNVREVGYPYPKF